MGQRLSREIPKTVKHSSPITKPSNINHSAATYPSKIDLVENYKPSLQDKDVISNFNAMNFEIKSKDMLQTFNKVRTNLLSNFGLYFYDNILQSTNVYIELE